VRERVAEFKDQVERRLAGQLTEDEFRPLRLRNGLYLQLHAYMLRIAIPYGVLSPKQLRQLAMIGRRWDRSYGHFTTRQNLQFNWVKLVDIPEVLAALAEVEMHCIQTSGNCVRNVTADPFAGAANDELEVRIREQHHSGGGQLQDHRRGVVTLNMDIDATTADKRHPVQQERGMPGAAIGLNPPLMMRMHHETFSI